MATPHTSAPTLSNGSPGNAATANESFRRVERSGIPIIIAKQNAPPGSPNQGDDYLVGATGSGAWASLAEDTWVRWDGSGWLNAGVIPEGFVFSRKSDKKVYVKGSGGAGDFDGPLATWT